MLITPLYGEVLILFILIVCCLRTYFIKTTRLDSLASFSVLALGLSIVQILNWGFNLCELIVFVVSAVVFIVNYRSFVRFCNHLYIDSYTKFFITASSIALALVVFSTVILFCNAPYILSPKKYHVSVESFSYAKQDDGTYKESSDLFGDKRLKLSIYSPDRENPNKNDTVILFVPDKRAGLLAYEPYFVLLAKSGYKVYCGRFDFSTVNDSKSVKINSFLQRKLIQEVRKENSEKKYFSEHPEYYNAYAKEFEVLSSIADERESVLKKFVIAGDGASGDCFNRITNPARKIYKCFSLSSVDEYKTSGFGFIQQTDPLSARMLYGLKPDRNSFIPSYSVMKTKQAFEDIQ